MLSFLIIFVDLCVLFFLFLFFFLMTRRPPLSTLPDTLFPYTTLFRSRLSTDLTAIRDGRRQRLGGGYPREVAPLAEAMNAVLEHDSELIERARTHVGNLAHGLKTPLAVLQA